MISKRCVVCNCVLGSENTKKYRLKNYIYKCNECIKNEKRLYARTVDKSKISIYSKTYRESLATNNPIKYTCRNMLSDAKKRSMKYGMKFDLSLDYLISMCPKICPVFKEELKYGSGEKIDMSASVDRIDNDKGYTKGNIQIISYLANAMKSSASKDQLILFSLWIQGSRDNH